jgi:hypothetical protein
MHNRPVLGGTGHRRYRPVGAAQLDIVSGIPLSDGRAAKLVTGIDDHSRFVVISAVVMVPTGRAVCEASAAAMRRAAVAGRLRAFLSSAGLPEGWVCMKARPVPQNPGRADG